MEDKNPIQVADRMFQAIELLVDRGPMELKDISSNLNLNKSTTHRVLSSLAYMGYVRQECESGKYELTFKIVELSNKIIEKTDIVHIIRPFLKQLMELTGETVHLVELEGTEAVYIEKVVSFSNTVQMVSRIGSRIPLYCSGVGKAIIAEMEDQEIKEFWAGSKIVKRTAHTITDFAEFMEGIREAREKGYALDNEENEPGIRCIAVSLPDFGKNVRYAISISAPVTRMDDLRIQELAECALAIKQQIMLYFVQ